MKTAAIVSLFVVIPLALCALLSFNHWRQLREVEQMKKEADFVLWLDKVNAELRQYGYYRSERRDADWLIDFEAGTAAHQAAKNFLARPPSP